MRIQARKCPFTGTVFEEKDRMNYVTHLQELRSIMRASREQKRIKDTWTEWLYAEKLKITRPEQIPAWFLANQKTIMYACNAVEGTHRWFDDNFVPEDVFTKLNFSEPKFSECVSNTHNCPASGVTNFMCKDDLPRGYVGWTSYVNGTLVRPKKHDGSYPYSGALKMVGLHTGSGGGGNKNFGYDIKIFLDDWPGLKAAVTRIKRVDAVSKARKEQEEVIRRLKYRR